MCGSRKCAVVRLVVIVVSVVWCGVYNLFFGFLLGDGCEQYLLVSESDLQVIYKAPWIWKWLWVCVYSYDKDKIPGCQRALEVAKV